MLLRNVDSDVTAMRHVVTFRSPVPVLPILKTFLKAFPDKKITGSGEQFEALETLHLQLRSNLGGGNRFRVPTKTGLTPGFRALQALSSR